MSQISNYFDVMKINKREMLHLHCLVWLADNLKFHNLWDWLQNDLIFSDNMIHYLESVVKCFVNLAVENLEILRIWLQSFLTKDSESDSIFIYYLHYNSNVIAFKCQMHNKNHSHICFKKVKLKFQECRFLFSHKLVTDIHINKYEMI